MRSTLILLVSSTLFLAWTSPLLAQTMKDNPECRNWNSVVGEWNWTVESKETPTGNWQRGPAGTWTAKWLYDGKFFQWQGQYEDGTSYLHIFGYDLLLKTHTSAGVTSEGWRWIVKSGDWNGDVFTANWLDIDPEGTRINGRCIWDYTSDFSSATISCDQFTEGRWWKFRRFKGKKVK